MAAGITDHVWTFRELFLDAYPQNEALPLVTDAVISAMADYHRPGNIRQLQNVLI